MRVGVLTSTRVPGTTAHGQHISQLVRALIADSHAVALSSRGPLPPALAEQVAAHVAIADSDSGFGAWAAAGKVRFGLGPVDIVYALDVRQAACWVPSRIPLVLEVHSAPGTAFHRWLDRLIGAHRHVGPARIVAISHSLAAEYRTRVKGVEVVCAPSSAMPVVSEEHEAPAWFVPGAFNVAYVGGLYHGRGVPLMLELARRRPETSFHLIGGTDEQVRRWSSEASCNVRFYGHRPNEEVQGCYQHVDVALAPYEPVVQVSSGSASTHRWMSPMKLVEYFAFGVPVIASDLPAIRELVPTDGSSALLRAPGDIDGWSQGLQKLEDDHELRRSLRVASRAFFRENLAWDVRVRRMLDGLVR